MVMNDGTVIFNWYNGDIKIEQENPCLTRCRNGMKIEYGKTSDNGNKSFMELLDYDSGELAERWERIK